jgi:hypothetical protein
VEGVQAMRRNRRREIATFGGGFRERQLTVCAHEAGGRRHNHSDVDVYTHRRAASRSGRIRVVSLHREHDLPQSRVATTYTLNDLHEHLGQLVAYARMNSIVPPWSRKG